MKDIRNRLLPTAVESEELLRLALPVVIVQVGMMAMGVVDSIMVGHISPAALAAVALGNMYFFACAIFGVGVLMALDPIVAQAVGAGDEPAVARGVQRGIVLAAVLTLPASGLLLTASPVLTFLGQPKEVIPLASGYAVRMIPGVFPFLVYTVFRQSLQAMGRVAPIVITIVAANLVNALLNWIWIYGRAGFPAMGVVGSAWATTTSRGLMAVGLLALAWRDLARYLLPVRPRLLDPQALWRMLHLGLPIGAQFQLEYGAFAVIALLMGWLGTVQVAAHQVAINLASLTFMVPLGVSAAAAVLVGHAVGRADSRGARRAARTALVYGVGFMSLTALAFLVLPGPLAGAYTSDPGVLALAAALIPIAGVFQVFDGLQVVGAGILRGLGDTRVPLIINLLGFWLVGIPVSLSLGFRTTLGAAGLWWGFVAGLGTVALSLLLRIRLRMQRDLPRVKIDDVSRELPVPAA
ncbi:MAG: MATE family efflux transporter [Acidobacteria bacterium]|nr:MATE family efflux transporter [Acidobacteriota bacterium]